MAFQEPSMDEQLAWQVCFGVQHRQCKYETSQQSPLNSWPINSLFLLSVSYVAFQNDLNAEFQAVD